MIVDKAVQILRDEFARELEASSLSTYGRLRRLDSNLYGSHAKLVPESITLFFSPQPIALSGLSQFCIPSNKTFLQAHFFGGVGRPNNQTDFSRGYRLT